MSKLNAVIALLAAVAVVGSNAATTPRSANNLAALQFDTVSPVKDTYSRLVSFDSRRDASDAPAFRAATLNEGGSVSCSADIDYSAVVEDAVCDKRKKCSCPVGGYFEPNGNYCNKTPTSKAECETTCKKVAGKPATCADFEKSKKSFSCGCPQSQGGKWFIWDDPDLKLNCIEYTLAMCNKDCKDEFGKDATCDEKDYTTCNISA